MQIPEITHLWFHSGDGAAHDEPVASLAAIPLGPDPFDADIREPCGLKPLHVLLLRWKQHKRVCEEPGNWEGGMHRPNEAGDASWLDHTVCLLHHLPLQSLPTDPDIVGSGTPA